jgi:hypothetical protein
MHSTPHHPLICDARVRLPLELARTALAWARKPADDPAEIRYLRCTLEAHTVGDHYAHVTDIATDTAGWTRWPQGGSPAILLVLADCPATGPGLDACSEYEGHPGGHTWQVEDPWNPHPGSGSEEAEEHDAAGRTAEHHSMATAFE